MRVLITGAGGLIGSWLLRHLNDKGVEAVSVSHRETDLLEPGASDRLLEQGRPDGVVHLAWCASGTADYRRSPDNARWQTATLELRDACRRHEVSLWATGTIVDPQPTAPDAYSAAKSALRTELSADIDAGRIGWLRPAYVFDEAARRPDLLAHALAARDRGEAVELQTPDSRHDFVHASDVALAIATVLDHRLMGVLPIGSGDMHRVSELVGALGVRWRPASEQADAVTRHAENSADMSWLTELGWRPVRTSALFGSMAGEPDISKPDGSAR